MMPPTPATPRTFAGDPNPPPEKLEAPPMSSGGGGESTSAGTGSLPPEASSAVSTSAAPQKDTQRSYSVIERPDGSRDAFVSDPKGDQKLWSVNSPDADKILHATGNYDPVTKTWSNLPEAVVKSLGTGRLAFPDRIMNAWEGGETGVVRSLLGAKLMYGEMTGAQAKEQGDPLLLKVRLDEDPSIAWQGGFSATIAEMLKHPVNTAESAAVGVAGMAPLMKDILLHGTAPYAAGAAAAGAGAAGVGMAVGGPLGPGVALAAVTNGLRIGATYGTFKRSMDLFGGQFAMDMADKGYDDKAIQKYAPVVGAINGALTLMRFDLMTPAMKSAAITEVLGSSAVKSMLNSWLVKYGEHVAGFAALGTAQEAVNLFTGNMAAIAEHKPELLTAGPEAKKRLLDTALQATMAGVILGAPGAAFGARAEMKAGLGGEAIEPGQAAGQGEASAKPANLLEPSLEPRQGEIKPSLESIKDHPAYVKAQETAAPVLKEEAAKLGLDPKEPGVAQQVRKSLHDQAWDLTNEIKAKGLKPGSPEYEAASEKVNSLVERMYTTSRQAEIEADPSNAEKFAEIDSNRAAAEKPAEREFVKTPDIEIKRGENDKATAEEIRYQKQGAFNEQRVRGNQLAEEIRRQVPDPAERSGMFWYKAAGGDEAVLQDALTDPKLEAYHPEIEKALNLSDKAKEALSKVSQYYDEAGQVSKEMGTINNVRENYQNRIYTPEPPSDFVKSETNAGIKQTTRHAKQRVFETEFDAARAGKTFATTDVADALSIHNEEMARVNTSRNMADAMAQAKLGAWKRDVPEGWARVGTLEKNVPIKDKAGNAIMGEDGNQVVSHSVFVAPEGIAKGLEAIADPDFVKKIDVLRGIQKFQGLVKTADLAFSAYHPMTFLAQTIYQRDISALLSLGKMDEFLSNPTNMKWEQDGAAHSLVTSAMEANQDILRNLATSQEGFADAIVNHPIAKAVLNQVDKNANFIFGKMQRTLKIANYSSQVMNWIADHPAATNEEVVAAKRGIARNVNAVYGGLNWEAMGMTKSNLSLLRLGLLAPDWTISNIQLLKQAIGERGTAGNASRAHILTALTTGMIATEGINKILTGHYTDENEPGHQLEVEIAPNVYVSMLRGGIGDITKFASMVAESGAGGIARFIQGKGAPFARTSAGLLTNTQYTGGPIVPKNAGPVAGTYDVLKYALQNAGPVPFGISNLLSYARSDEPNAVGAAAVASGTGRFSKGK